MALEIIDHPLLRHKLNFMRDKHTPSERLRSLLEEITLMAMPFILSELPLRTERVETPMGVGSFEFVEEDRFVFVCILRAGLPMLSGALRALPRARAGFFAIKRDEHSSSSHRKLFHRMRFRRQGGYRLPCEPCTYTVHLVPISTFRTSPACVRHYVELDASGLT